MRYVETEIDGEWTNPYTETNKIHSLNDPVVDDEPQGPVSLSVDLTAFDKI